MASPLSEVTSTSGAPGVLVLHWRVFTSCPSSICTEDLDWNTCTADMGQILAKIAAHSRPFFQVKAYIQTKSVKNYL